MRKKEWVQFIQKTLDHYFPEPPIPLNHKDPYTLLIAVLLSAQCTDERVNKVTPDLFKRASTPAAMAKVPVKEIESFIKTCGLSPTKSKAIHTLSNILIEKYDGQVPQTFEELEALPGVGHKTASVVMAQAFHTPAFPVDTHIHRCAQRWGLSTGKNVKQTESDLKKLFPKKDWIKLHLQVIYFARAFCTAKKHDAATCPICSKLGVA
ncbi:MAG: endonuclease III [Parachlamydiales bacterium]|jgi:endonuclease-3